jgi:hypothetical protein
MWYKMCACEPRKNRSKVKEGLLEEENENILASAKEEIITGSENAVDMRHRNGRKVLLKHSKEH